MVTGAKGSVKSVSTYNGGKQSIVEFTEAQPEIMEGQKITFAGSSVEGFNSTYVVHKMNDRKIVVDYAYAAVADATSAVNIHS